MHKKNLCKYHLNKMVLLRYKSQADKLGSEIKYDNKLLSMRFQTIFINNNYTFDSQLRKDTDLSLLTRILSL